MIKLMSFVMRFFFLSSVNFIFFRKNLLFAQARIFGNKTLTLYVVRNVPSNFNCAKNIFFVCPLDYHHRAKRRNLFTSFAFHLPSMVFTLEVQAAQTKPPKRKKKSSIQRMSVGATQFPRILAITQKPNSIQTQWGEFHWFALYDRLLTRISGHLLIQNTQSDQDQ